MEQLFHGLVLFSGIGAVIQGNIWLYGLYGGLAAGKVTGFPKYFFLIRLFIRFYWEHKVELGDDNRHLAETGVRYFCARSKQLVIATSNRSHPAFQVDE